MTDYPILPFFVRDYLADTRHLTAREHGAYLLLIFECWQRPRCCLPHNDELLSRLACMPLDEWNSIKSTVLAFFTLDKRRNEITQKRLSKERGFVEHKRGKKRDAAVTRWDKTKKEHASAMQMQCIRNANAMQRIRISIEERKKESTPTIVGVPKKERTPPTPSAPSARAPKVALVGSRIDPDRKPGEAELAFARRHGIPDDRVMGVWEHFVAYHVAKGDVSKSWPHSWQTWVKNDENYRRTQPRAGPQARRTRMDDVKDLISEGWLDGIQD